MQTFYSISQGNRLDQIKGIPTDHSIVQSRTHGFTVDENLCLWAMKFDERSVLGCGMMDENDENEHTDENESVENENAENEEVENENEEVENENENAENENEEVENENEEVENENEEVENENENAENENENAENENEKVENEKVENENEKVENDEVNEDGINHSDGVETIVQKQVAEVDGEGLEISNGKKIDTCEPNCDTDDPLVNETKVPSNEVCSESNETDPENVEKEMQEHPEEGDLENVTPTKHSDPAKDSLPSKDMNLAITEHNLELTQDSDLQVSQSYDDLMVSRFSDDDTMVSSIANDLSMEEVSLIPNQGMKSSGMVRLMDDRPLEIHPIIVKYPDSFSFQREGVHLVSCGLNFSILVTVSGSIYVNGKNSFGQLGLGHTQDFRLWTKLEHPALNGKHVTHLSCGDNHTVMVLDGWEIVCFGNNEDGQCGCSIEFVKNILEPNRSFCLVDDSDDTSRLMVKDLCCGSDFTLILTTDGKLFSFGKNSYGQLFHGHTENVKTATQVGFTEKILKICAGYNHSLLVCDDKVFLAGEYLDKQIIDPACLPLPPGVSVTGLAAGENYSYILCDWGTEVYSFGANHHGQCCHFDGDDVAMPSLVECLDDLGISQVFCNRDFVIISTFVRRYDIDRLTIVQNDLLHHFRNPQPLMHDKELIVDGKVFKVCGDLLLVRYPTIFELHNTKHLLTSTAFQIFLEFIYSDELHTDNVKKPEYPILELYMFLVQRKSHESTLKLERLLLQFLIQNTSEENVINLFKRCDDYASKSAVIQKKKTVVNFRKHCLAYIKRLMDKNELSNVPNYKLLFTDPRLMQEIVLQGGFYEIMTNVQKIVQENPIQYRLDLESLYNNHYGNLQLVLDSQHIVRCHRFIVSARCPEISTVLSKHFQSQTTPNVAFGSKLRKELWSVFIEFIEMLYTGQITITPRNAMGILDLWNIFKMDSNDLVCQYAQKMASHTLNIDNVLPMYRNIQEAKKNSLSKSGVLGNLEKKSMKILLGNWKYLHLRYQKDLLRYLSIDAYFAMNYEVIMR